jgi:hypothetical protein
MSVLFLDLILLIPLLIFIIGRPTLHDGWRHFYFIYPVIIVNVVIAVKWLIERFEKLKALIFLVIGLNSLVLLSWMVRNHPYQLEYFNAVVIKSGGSNLFEFNTFRSGRAEVIQYLLGRHDGQIYVAIVDDFAGHCHTSVVLTSQLTPRVNIVLHTSDEIRAGTFSDNIQYVIDESRWILPDKYDGLFKEIYYREIDGDSRIFMLFKRL